MLKLAPVQVAVPIKCIATAWPSAPTIERCLPSGPNAICLNSRKRSSYGSRIIKTQYAIAKLSKGQEVGGPLHSQQGL
jgi:hypothetical protein